MRRLIPLLLMIAGCSFLGAQTPNPAVFYSDIISGPAVSTNGHGGAMPCIFGENFGATSTGASIAIGGVNGTIVYWNDPGYPYKFGQNLAEACFELGSTTPTGLNPIILTNSVGSSTNYPCSSIPTDPGYNPTTGAFDPVDYPPNATYPNSRYVYPCFTVRAGNIYFMGPAGNDSTGNGSYANPWLTTAHTQTQMVAGDIAYGLNGLLEATGQSNGSKASLNIHLSGTAGNPIAIGCYPGATCTATSTDATTERVFNNEIAGAGGVSSHWAIFGWTMQTSGLGGNAMSIGGGSGSSGYPQGTDFRIVNNYTNCEASIGCNFEAAVISGGMGQYIYILGNYVRGGCHETLPNYTSSTTPCPWSSNSVTFSTIGTALTFSGFPSAVVGDVIENTSTSELRELIASSSETAYTLDSAFASNAPAGTAFQYRGFVPDKTFHGIYMSTETQHTWIGYNEVDGSWGHFFRGIQFYSTPVAVGGIITASTALAGSTETWTISEFAEPWISGTVNLQVGTGGTPFAAPLTAQSTLTAAAATLNANSSFTANSLVATVSGSYSLVVTGPPGASGSTTLINPSNITDSKYLYSAGAGEYDSHVFNNYVHDSYGDCINFGTPAQQFGPVEAYDNVLVNCGVEAYWFPPSAYGGQTCVQSSAVCNNTDGFVCGSGTIEIYNNSCMGFGYTQCAPSGCGSRGVTGSQGAWNIGNGGTVMPDFRVRLRNNITVASSTSSTSYFSTQGGQNAGFLCTGTTTDPYCSGPSLGNEYYGNGNGPSNTGGNVNANPLWVNPSANNLHLQSSSPAVNAGTTSGAASDADGFTQTTPNQTIGAYVYYSGPPAALVSIAITPSTASIFTNQNQGFSATCTYSDSSTQNCTSTVTWSSSNTAAATINASGTAQPVGAGTTTINAALGTVPNGTALLTVQVAPSSIEIGVPAIGVTQVQ